MALGEFDIIARYFNRDGLAATPAHTGVSLGIGDDCALLRVAPTDELALSMDVLVEGVHFLQGAPADEVARRALAVNLSDLAAMGALPLGFMLGLTLPGVDEHWLAGFSEGLRESALHYGCPLLGGNLTRGPLQIAIQVQGTVPRGCAILRSGARPGDLIYVSGRFGAAGLALRWLLGEFAADAPLKEQLARAYYRPEPRLRLGRALVGRASAAQDVSDGLLADLGHLLRASGVGARVYAARIPVAPALSACLSAPEALALAAGAGDDYELVFTLPPLCASEVRELAAAGEVPLTCIGEVLPGEGLTLVDEHGHVLPQTRRGF
ncbi:MAG: thiamine-phosphate kinase, partial [Pseudomonadales bacterium]|nr:thiamine-phosphate kinase [Pseudomonadales bacterium]